MHSLKDWHMTHDCVGALYVGDWNVISLHKSSGCVAGNCDTCAYTGEVLRLQHSKLRTSPNRKYELNFYETHTSPLRLALHRGSPSRPSPDGTFTADGITDLKLNTGANMRLYHSEHNRFCAHRYGSTDRLHGCPHPVNGKLPAIGYSSSGSISSNGHYDSDAASASTHQPALHV